MHGIEFLSIVGIMGSEKGMLEARGEGYKVDRNLYFLGVDLLGYGWVIVFRQRRDYLIAIWGKILMAICVLLPLFLNFSGFDKMNFL